MTAETDGPDPLDPTSSMLAFFGTEVARIRLDRGVSQDEAARLAHTTQSMMSKIESAKRLPSKELVRDLDAAFETGGHFGRLYPLVLRYAYPAWFLPYVQHERDACSLRVFDSQVVPGLLQTEDYARAMLSAVRSNDLSGLVAARMSRQGIFDRDDPPPPLAWFVIDEQALQRAIGTADVRREQFARLLTAGEDPRTVIQVLPASAGAHPGLAGPFTLMSSDGSPPDVLHVDGFSQGRMTYDAGEVADATRAYDLLRAQALSPTASADLISLYMEDLSPCSTPTPSRGASPVTAAPTAVSASKLAEASPA